MPFLCCKYIFFFDSNSIQFSSFVPELKEEIQIPEHENDDKALTALLD